MLIGHILHRPARVAAEKEVTHAPSEKCHIGASAYELRPDLMGAHLCCHMAHYMEYLVLYRWPGNTRELANEMRRLAVMAESGAVMMPEHLAPEIAASRRTIPASERVLDPTEIVVRLDQPMPAAVRYLEERMVHNAMKKCGGRVEDAAAMLGLSRKGLYLKRQRFGIEPPPAAVSATRSQL